ncbi:MAG: lysophospholipid acyltransferase family protein [Smithellaceae bacterium]|nr:lysophospholipid acyltransferase family protein [Smithellaceae bacterium]
MVDLEYLKKIKLVANPIGQKVVGTLMLMPNYNLFAKVDIVIENKENIPRKENVIFAMNHTDRFNYWPFQYKLWRLRDYPYTTVWVKGKYYKNAILAKGLDLCNLIPVPSMGYLVEEIYKQRVNRAMDKGVYRAVKDFIDGKLEKAHLPNGAAEALKILGDNFAEYIRAYHERVMDKVAELSKRALHDKKLNIIIFPEGTRSVQLAEGRTGLAQLALHTGTKIVPIGCNNSEQVYPGNLPFAKSGRIIYRAGEPLSVDDQLKEFKIKEGFTLFSKESQKRYRDNFEGVTKVVMTRIGELLDERYRQVYNEV